MSVDIRHDESTGRIESPAKETEKARSARARVWKVGAGGRARDFVKMKRPRLIVAIYDIPLRVIVLSYSLFIRGRVSATAAQSRNGQREGIAH